MEQFLARHGIKHNSCALYHPETNGMVERFSRVLKGTIEVAKSAGLDWREEIFKKVEIYGLSPHTITKRTPFELFRGRRANTLVAPTWVNDMQNSRDVNCRKNDWKFG